MTVLVESTVELDYCVKCHNVWFDAEELDQYCAQNGIAFSMPIIAATHESARMCPSCTCALGRAHRDGIVVEKCTSCSGVLISSQSLDGLLPCREPNKAISAIEKSVSVVESIRSIVDLMKFFQ